MEILGRLRRLIRPAREWPHGNVWRSDADPFTIAFVHLFSVKLPAELHAVFFREAKRRNVSRSVLARELIAHALGDRGSAPSPSCADLAGNLIGAVHSGRSDLATNSSLLDEDVVQDSHGLPLPDIADDCSWAPATRRS